MSDSDSQAARLHRMLDEIICAKADLKAADGKLDTAVERQELSGDALQIFSDAADLLTELIDDDVSEIAFGAFPDTDDPDRFRWTAMDMLVEKLQYFVPVLGAPNWSWWVSNFVDELTLISFGDEPRLLKPAERSKGRKSQPGRKAFLRLQALQWMEYMDACGISPFVRDSLVGGAYKERPDTIRKWKKACGDVLSDKEVRHRLDAAKKSSWAGPSYLTTNEAGETTLSEKGRAALEAEGLIYQECLHSELR